MDVRTHARIELHVADEQIFYAFTYGTAGWLGLQALSLIVAPKIIITMLAPEVHRATGKCVKSSSCRYAQSSTDLELYFARCLGFSLVTLALIALFFTGTIPVSTSTSQPVSLEDNDPKAPYAVAIVNIMTIWHSISLIYCWVCYTHSGQAGYVLGALGYGSLAGLGMGVVLFGTSGGKFSRRTGADKRTSGFPFKNEAAYNKKKDKKMI